MPKISEGTLGTGDWGRDARACWDRCGRFPYAMAYACERGNRPSREYFTVIEPPEQLALLKSFAVGQERSDIARWWPPVDVKLEPMCHGNGWHHRDLHRRVWYRMEPDGDWLSLHEVYAADAVIDVAALPADAGPSA